MFHLNILFSFGFKFQTIQRIPGRKVKEKTLPSLNLKFEAY